ncbi:amidohydrolase family protein [Nitrosospira sp. NpAV]|uniref:amidohydrolase family protein n=1 Tax=Nitrosospira sp. NpAV TaxID=58133 RepID=UPI0005A211D0|nr:amidohydrolase family protein [Nitrosospira sp. NpAV]KIO49889.1 amidohydrolase [Nitrosospira sp. NpAV]
MMKCTPLGLISRFTACLCLIPAMLTSSFVIAQESGHEAILLHAARVFDGNNVRTNTSVLVINGQVAKIDARESFKPSNANVIDLGDATILPGFIELHAHLSFQNIPAGTVLKHGITTIRDVGGPVHKPYGGNGSLRVLTSGPIITAPNGYPIPMLGKTNIATEVSTEKEARETVRDLINGGAVVIKVALEPGGEAGAPWSSGHDHGHDSGHGHGHHDQRSEHAPAHPKPAHDASKQTWPLLSENVVKAIVDEAHKHNRKVTAHIAEAAGARIAINAGIDEWAHMPCDAIPESLLKKAVEQDVKIVTTLDTLSKCSGVAHNAAVWAALGGELLYGAEIAHPDIPRGIDAQELIYMRQMAKMGLIDVLRAATSKAGQHLNWPLLGTLQPGAPADIIAVRGDPSQNLKILEYPDLVISGGKIIVNDFGN